MAVETKQTQDKQASANLRELMLEIAKDEGSDMEMRERARGIAKKLPKKRPGSRAK